MDVQDEEMGPVDVAVIAYPRGAPMTGDAVPLLLDLVNQRIIRVLDVMFMVKEDDGTVLAMEAKGLDAEHVGDLVALEGASSGLLGQSDAAKAGAELEPGSGAAMIVYENRWAAPLISAVRRNGGVAVAFERISGQDLIEALDTAEAVS